MAAINVFGSLAKRVRGSVQHFNQDKYWKMREYCIKSQGGVLACWYLYRIKRMDAFNNASLGTNIGTGALFAGMPKFPHGLYGIIISPQAKIGSNVTIFHGVTIGNDYRDIHHAPTIGNNVKIYPGAVIIGKVVVGNNVEIGANAVVTTDVPDGALVVCEKARIIERK